MNRDSELSRYIDPIKEYYIQTEKMINTIYGYRPENKEIIKKIVKRKAIDPMVRGIEKKVNGNLDSLKKDTKLSLMLESIREKRLNTSATFSLFLPVDVKLSLVAKFITEQLAYRKRLKREMFDAKLNGMLKTYLMKYAQQKMVKQGLLDISGGMSVMGSPLYAQSAHPVMTSTIRAITSLSNACNERFIGGNLAFFTPDHALVNFLSIESYLQRKPEKLKALKDTIERYQLKIPTVEDVVHKAKRCYKLYSNNPDETRFLTYVEKSDPISRAGFCYYGDLKTLRELNETFIYNFLNELTVKVHGDTDQPTKAIYKFSEPIRILAGQICYEETKGLGTDIEKIKKAGAFGVLYHTCIHIQKVTEKYWDFFGLAMTDNIPPSVSAMPKFIRRVVAVSNTDSSCASVDEFITWYTKGDVRLNAKTAAIAGAIIYQATLTIHHAVKVFSINMNTDLKDVGRLSMKSEMSWVHLTVSMNMKNHYYCGTYIAEGNIFAKTQLDVSGAHLINATLPKEVIQTRTDLMNEIGYCVENNKMMRYATVIATITKLERVIYDTLKEGVDLKYYQIKQIKSVFTYALGEEAAPYLHYLFWDRVFKPSKGDVGSIPYTAVRVLTKLPNKTALNAWIATIKDSYIRENVVDWLAFSKKTDVNHFDLPRVNISTKGMPDEILRVIDYERIITNSCSPIYVVLETLGIVIPENMTLTEYIYGGFY